MWHFAGLGRHSTEEIIAFIKQDLDAIFEFVPKSNTTNYLFSDSPSSFDASLYAFLVNLVYGPEFQKKFPGDLYKFVTGQQHVVDYVNRIKNQYFKEDKPQLLYPSK